MPKTIAVDFDGVICNPNDVAPGKRMGNPMPGCKERMDDLKRAGHTLIIHTVRATPDRDTQYLKDWLSFFSIPFDSIAVSKPNADIYLDDRAIRFTDWDTAFNAIINA